MSRSLRVFPLVGLLVLTAAKPQAQVRIATYNIRYDNPADGIHAWENRKAHVASLIRFHKIDIVCIQEALIQQVRYLKEQLAGFEYCGVGRDDGREEGEFSSIFYNTNRFEILETNTIWLSPTPSVVSEGWDAAIVRIMTWVHFRDKQSGKQFYVFNTHFDHVGVVARKESAHLVRKFIRRIAGNRSAILAGDFDSTENDDPYKIITRQDGAAGLALKDAKMISRTPRIRQDLQRFRSEAGHHRRSDRLHFRHRGHWSTPSRNTFGNAGGRVLVRSLSRVCGDRVLAIARAGKCVPV